MTYAQTSKKESEMEAHIEWLNDPKQPLSFIAWLRNPTHGIIALNMDKLNGVIAIAVFDEKGNPIPKLSPPMPSAEPPQALVFRALEGQGLNFSLNTIVDESNLANVKSVQFTYSNASPNHALWVGSFRSERSDVPQTKP